LGKERFKAVAQWIERFPVRIRNASFGGRNASHMPKMKKALQREVACRAALKNGVAERIRTSDFFLRREALYPLSYSNVLITSTPIG
jgi:hypothetical protein